MGPQADYGMVQKESVESLDSILIKLREGEGALAQRWEKKEESLLL